MPKVIGCSMDGSLLWTSLDTHRGTLRCRKWEPSTPSVAPPWLTLARIGDQERHAAVAKAEMRHLHLARHGGEWRRSRPFRGDRGLFGRHRREQPAGRADLVPLMQDLP